MFFYILYVCRSTPKNFDVKITASTFKSLKMVLFGDLFLGGVVDPGRRHIPAGRSAGLRSSPHGEDRPPKFARNFDAKITVSRFKSLKMVPLGDLFFFWSSTDDLLDFHGCRGSTDRYHGFRFSRISGFPNSLCR